MGKQVKRPLLVVRNVLIDAGGRVLLGLRKDRLLWELPGGKVDDEPVLEACRRENLEETGILLGAADPLLLGYYDQYSKKFRRRVVDLIFRFSKWTGRARVMPENKHVRWEWRPLPLLPLSRTESDSYMGSTRYFLETYGRR